MRVSDGLAFAVCGGAMKRPCWRRAGSAGHELGDAARAGAALRERVAVRELAAHTDLLRGMAWGEACLGHPEGRVGLHVASILARIGGYPWMGE
jgi:hypothetical protein